MYLLVAVVIMVRFLSDQNAVASRMCSKFYLCSMHMLSKP